MSTLALVVPFVVAIGLLFGYKQYLLAVALIVLSGIMAAIVMRR